MNADSFDIDMIKDAILNLKERNGSSRQSIKKYVLANNKIAPASTNAFDSQFNKAIKAGVEKGEFTNQGMLLPVPSNLLPSRPSGPVKLAKKEAAPKPAAKKSTTTAKPKKATATTTKKAEKAEKAEKPKATTKKTGTTTAKRSVGRPKANTAKPRKASTAAPAVVDQPKVIGKTKSGRVTKTTAKPEKATKKSTKKA
ncbi:histone H1 [Aspergillus nomiae NRRL 13137]|uniref:Histone H1 n=1 Tax=Aspergillus nomiae NRRL (strain ATCC 15546 / NRRL 13137 / CBS 260.88 / M93) TaxID=1509407 RepID=A0A0L1J0M7_ASPN3|nr:histone H1 [Aspergillus nomiae NRRL 13137]KNG85220.1 histone H1 [Aspergillus nomiae NRRL 13137]